MPMGIRCSMWVLISGSSLKLTSTIGYAELLLDFPNAGLVENTCYLG